MAETEKLEACRRCDDWGEVAYFGELVICPVCKGEKHIARPSPTAGEAQIIAHIEKYDTPREGDPRRRYTRAQVETAIRLATPETPSGGQPVGEESDLIRRVEWILDMTASAKDRLGRRACLTNHDLRTILAALRSQGGEGLREALKRIQRLAERCESLPDTDGLRRAYRDIDTAARAALHPTEPEAVSGENERSCILCPGKCSGHSLSELEAIVSGENGNG